MKALLTSFTALLFLSTFVTSFRGSGQITPCFIPLPELRITDATETFTAFKSSTTTVENTFETTTLADVASSTDHCTQSTTTIPIETINESQAEIQSHTDLVATSDANKTTVYSDNPAASDECSSWDKAAAQVAMKSESTSANNTSTPTFTTETTKTPIVSEASTILMLVPTQQEAVCIPYCAAIDENERCVSIRGCGYPDEGNFGRHGCCPPGYYSGSEVLGLVTFAVSILTVVYLRL